MTLYLTGPFALDRVVVERQGPTTIAVWTGEGKAQRAAAWVYPATRTEADAYMREWAALGAELDGSTGDDPYDGPSEAELRRAERQQMGICG
jgi:hypothetical protein